MARRLVYTAFMSLDGVVDSPGSTAEGHPSGGWVMETDYVPETFALKAEELAETSAMMLGRRSYEAFAPVWRDSPDHAEYRDLPKYVVSTTLDESRTVSGWGDTTVLSSTADVAALKEQDGGAVFIHGSATLARSLADADLIDQYNLLVFPVLLGAGKSLFNRDVRPARRLRLRTSESYPNGVVKLVYDVPR